MKKLTNVLLGLITLSVMSVASAYAQETNINPVTDNPGTLNSTTTTTNTDNNPWMNWWWLLPLIGLPLLLILAMSGGSDSTTVIREEPQVTYHDVKKSRVKREEDIDEVL